MGLGGAAAGSALGPWGLAAMIGSSIAGPVISSLFAPDGQELKSFEGTGLDPTKMLTGVQDIIGELGHALSDRASTPVSLPSAYVQQPGAYTGGGLPFPIGVVASDPALGNPSLLNLPGMGEFQSLSKLFGGMGTDPTGGYTPPHVPLNPGNPNFPGDDINIPGLEAPGNPGVPGDDTRPGANDDPPTSRPEFTGPRRRSFASDGGQLVRGRDLLTPSLGMGDDPAGATEPKLNGGDDLDQGIGAVQLLLEALRSGNGSHAMAL